MIIYNFHIIGITTMPFKTYPPSFIDADAVLPHAIPLKLLHFSNAVNVTLGLPIVRTSVDHGTAYDIAGKGIADPSSLKEAIRMAVILSTNRKMRHG